MGIVWIFIPTVFYFVFFAVIDNYVAFIFIEMYVLFIFSTCFEVYIERSVLNTAFRYINYTRAVWRQAFKKSLDLSLQFCKAFRDTYAFDSFRSKGRLWLVMHFPVFMSSPSKGILNVLKKYFSPRRSGRIIKHGQSLPHNLRGLKAFKPRLIVCMPFPSCDYMSFISHIVRQGDL